MFRTLTIILSNTLFFNSFQLNTVPPPLPASLAPVDLTLMLTCTGGPQATLYTCPIKLQLKTIT